MAAVAMYYAAAALGSRSRTATAAAVLVVSLSLPLFVPLGGKAAAVRRAVAQNLDDEGEFNYRWDAGNGPARWGTIRREWAACSVGRMQSPMPIGLSDTVAGLAERPGRLVRSYRPVAASLVNRGHDVMVRFSSNPGGVAIDGVAYRLRQMHWHLPSEHAVNGRRYALELHMLYQSDTGNKYAVISQLYTISPNRRDGTIRRGVADV